LGRGHLGGGKTVCRSSCAISSVDDGPRESHKKRRYSLGSRNARVRWQNRGLPPKVRAYGGGPGLSCIDRAITTADYRVFAPPGGRSRSSSRPCTGHILTGVSRKSERR